VKKGDVLATVDDTSLQDAVVDARLALSLTQVNIALQNVQATTETVAAAQAALNSAYASYNFTKAGNTPSAIESARVGVDSAWKQYLASQASRDVSCGSPRGLAAPACKQAEASYGNTFESWLTARDNYQKLLEPVTQDTLTQAWASVVAAQTKLDALKAGVTTQQATVDATQVDQAKATLQLAQSNLSKARLTSPCDCIVQEIDLVVGVLPPSTAFSLVDLTHIQFRTANLVENDIARIRVGAPVSIRLTSYPDLFSGKVSAILALSTGTQNGAALYTVLIDLDPAKVPLLPGMTGQAAVNTLQ
jgi:HlyD family secretion protein